MSTLICQYRLTLRITVQQCGGQDRASTAKIGSAQRVKNSPTLPCMDNAIELLEEDGKRFLLVVARHDDGNDRHDVLPRVRVVVAIATKGVFAVHVDLPLLFFDLCHGIEDESGCKAQTAQEHKRRGEHGGGEARNEAGLEILDNDGHAQGEAEYREQKRNEAEELQRTVVLEQRADHRNDFNAVAHGVEFGLGTLGTVAVLDGHIFDAPAVVDGVDRELGFDLKALGKHWEGFNERAAHGAVACHDVIEAVAIDPLDHGADQIIAKAVEGTLVLLGVGAVGKAIAYGHVGRAVKDGLAEGLGRLGGVGVVSVDHQVAIGVDIAKHLAAHVALSLTGLKADCGAVLGGNA